MAGAGYKLFNTGDVLTAAQVNTYLMEQTVMVFADAAARTTALTGVVSEGMISYLKDTNAVEVYNGSAWVSSDDPNAIQNTIVDAKGDLITATASDVPARLAVGNNGDTLLADSSTSTGLRWQGDYAAGKNLVTNGNMRIAQRGTTFNAVNTDSQEYLVDRWQYRYKLLGEATISQDTDAPAGFGNSFKVLVTSAEATPAAGDFIIFRQKFEGQALQGLAKGTASAKANTVSFWVKSNLTGTYIIRFSDVDNSRAIAATYTINSAGTWEKKTVTFPGDTTGTLNNDNGQSMDLEFWLGAGSDRTSGTLQTTWGTAVNANTAVGQVNLAGTLTNYWQVTGVQWEIGSVATDFQLSAGTLQGELAACQRYYWRQIANAAYGMFSLAIGTGTTTAQPVIKTPTTMRIAPTSVDYSTIGLIPPAGGIFAITNFTLGDVNENYVAPQITVASGLTSGTTYRLAGNNSATAYIGFSAEL
jgi:hypothetical protein